MFQRTKVIFSYNGLNFFGIYSNRFGLSVPPSFRQQNDKKGQVFKIGVFGRLLVAKFQESSVFDGFHSLTRKKKPDQKPVWKIINAVL